MRTNLPTVATFKGAINSVNVVPEGCPGKCGYSVVLQGVPGGGNIWYGDNKASLDAGWANAVASGSTTPLYGFLLAAGDTIVIPYVETGLWVVPDPSNAGTASIESTFSPIS